MGKRDRDPADVKINNGWFDGIATERLLAQKASLQTCLLGCSASSSSQKLLMPLLDARTVLMNKSLQLPAHRKGLL